MRLSIHLLCTFCVATLILSALAVPGAFAQATSLPSGIAAKDVENRTYLSYAQDVIDNLIQHGTDRYGPTQNNLLVSSINVETKNSVPGQPDRSTLDWEFRFEERNGRRSPGGSNFLSNQSVFRAMQRLAEVSGNNAYTDFVNANLDLGTANVGSNNTFRWGWHRYYDVHIDDDIGFSSSYHEMLGMEIPMWQEMYDRNPKNVTNAIIAIWNGHVLNKDISQTNTHGQKPGQTNRHEYNQSFTLSMKQSSSSFIEAFAFMSTKSPGIIPDTPVGEPTTWIDRAKLLANYHWNERNPDNNLSADVPDKAPSGRWWGLNATSTLPGVYAPALMRTYQLTGDTMFRDQALAYMRAYGNHAYDTATEQFWGEVVVATGKPVPGPKSGSNKPSRAAPWDPRGHADIWSPNPITAEHYPEAAQGFADAYKLTVDEGNPDAFLRLTADRWAQQFRDNPPKTGTAPGVEGELGIAPYYYRYSQQWSRLGTYAENYGRVIDFFVTMYDTTGEGHYLDSARDYAKEAISTLWYDGLLRGHPAKNYYEAVDGPGILLEALIDLDQHSGNFTNERRKTSLTSGN